MTENNRWIQVVLGLGFFVRLLAKGVTVVRAAQTAIRAARKSPNAAKVATKRIQLSAK
jgi:hypothetical protein